MTASLRRRVDQARLAMMLLTRLPTGRLNEPAPTLADARWAYPLVGLVVGAAGWLALKGGHALGFGDLTAAFIALGVNVVLTGGLHHDGLADFADGIGGGRDREHCLEIMRDSQIGSYGVLALIFAVVLGAGALATFEDGVPLGVLLLPAVASRLAMLVILDLLPPARGDGLGNMASGRDARRAWWPGAILIALIALSLDPVAWIALCVILLTAALIGILAFRRIGGQTGDVLGAVQLCCETAGYLALAVALSGQ